MALQTFTAGQVLTAAQVTALQTNNFNQTVSTKTASYTLVALDKGTRVVMNSASATTITVNTSLFNAGDTLQIHNIGAGVCTITAGTATVSTAGSLALPINAGGTLYFTSAGVAIFFPSASSSGTPMGVLLQSVTFSGVTSVSLPANSFIATYDNYQLVLNIDSSASAVGFDVRMRAAGTDNTSANYFYASAGAQGANANFAGASNLNVSLATSFKPSAISGTYTSSHILNIMMPFNSSYNTNFLCLGHYFDSLSNYSTSTVGGGLSVTTSYDSLTFFPGSGTISGIATLYGFSK